jgi:hypothetical protein
MANRWKVRLNAHERLVTRSRISSVACLTFQDQPMEGRITIGKTANSLHDSRT